MANGIPLNMHDSKNGYQKYMDTCDCSGARKSNKLKDG